MGADYHLIAAEQECEERTNEQIRLETAIHIVNGIDTVSAVKRAKEGLRLEAEAADDITGVTATLPEAQRPKMPLGKKKQVAAIARRLADADLV